MAAEERAQASWQGDPFGRHEQRWWDGEAWTEKVRSGGTTGIDPPGIVAKPEHAKDHIPAQPITDAAETVHYVGRSVPWMLLLGLVVFLAILVLVVVGIVTA